MRIQHNIMAMNAYRNLGKNNGALSKNLEKLSSGYRINRAGDDAAGLAISEKMRAQIAGLDQAQKNAQSGINLVQTAEGALTEVHDMLNRMVTLSTQAANGTYTETDREKIQAEINALCDEIDRIADNSNFNGQKLLDGSLTSVSENSFVSAINAEEYKAAGANDTFGVKYITNRPEAATTQTNAEFTVSLDDVAFGAGTAGTHSITLNVGDASITFNTADATAQTAAQLATGLVGQGKALDGADTTKNTLTGAAGGGNHVEINGNIYQMAANGNKITFTQVNNMGTGGEIVNPDFRVSAQLNAATGGNATGDVNDRVQVTTQGVGVGSSHQAEVDVTVDFTKLKDGDKLTVGNTTYTFGVGANTTNTGANCIDLSAILKTSEDLADADKQAEAMVKITDSLSSNTLWSAGNGGVSGNVGTISFHSLSTYTDGASDIAGTSTDAKMDTEANVMAQFRSEGAGNAANVSMEFDVTKIKAGDVMTVNGTTFEFTDGTRTSEAGYIAIDLSSKNISSGIAAYETDSVMTAIKTAVDTAFSSDYDTTVDGNKLTIASKDDASTTAVFENRVAADVGFGGGSGNGLTLQIGADAVETISVGIDSMKAESLGIKGLSVADEDLANKAIDTINAAIEKVSVQRGNLGAIQNRLEHTINNLGVMEENIQDAEANIRDTDIADEMMAYTKNNILIQSAQAMLAQANQVPQGVLQLMG